MLHEFLSNSPHRKVALEIGMNHGTVCLSISYLSPGSSGLVRFIAGSHCIILWLVYICLSLAQMKFSVILSIIIYLSFKESYILFDCRELTCSQQKWPSLGILVPLDLHSLQDDKKNTKLFFKIRC